MKYLTEKQIKKGVKGPKSALNFSIKHWSQNMRLKVKDAAKLVVADIIPVSGDLCGLCTWYDEDCYDNINNWLRCPVKKAGCQCGLNNNLYQKAAVAWRRWVKGYGTFNDWTKAATEMHKFLVSLK